MRRILSTPMVRAAALRPALASCFLTLVLLLGTSPCLAQKTDVIVLANGDTVTGDIKGLNRGYLEVSTDSLGYIDVVWVDAVQISSVHRFLVRVISGDEYIGTLRSPKSGQVDILGPEGAVITTVSIIAIVEIRPARIRFVERLDGSLQIGFNVARANKQRSWTLNMDTQYSGERWYGIASAGSSFSSQEGTESTSRNDVTLQAGRLLPERWFYAGIVRVEQNEELGLVLRAGLGGGFGRRFVETNRREFQMLGGFMVTRERFDDVEGTQTNLEALVMGRYDGFRRRSPKLDTTISFGVLPNLTDPGRVRSHLNISTSIEIFKNFYLALTAFDSFDSRPPDDALTKNDYGISPSVRWTF